jgi:simple sugar transport system ATP-binding protein
VTVARTLASDPVLIVAITPTRGVDVASKELLLSELDRITTGTGASLLLVSVVRQAVTCVDVVRITMQFLR